MTRRFWGGLMTASFILTGSAGAFLYVKLQEKEATATSEVSMPPETPPAADAGAPVALSTYTVVTPTATVTSPPLVKTGTRNILFKIARGTRQVYIIGDFNGWNRKALKKEGKVWQVSLPLEPGTYEYMFVVDDKRTRDPSNKRVSKSGNSVVNVKPLAEEK